MFKRRLWFVVSILIGIGIGLIYGWIFQPVQFSQVGLESLRTDYRTDYVLLVAELYQSNQDLALADNWLQSLGTEPPVRIVQSALVTAQSLGYDPEDLTRMNNLSEALILWSSNDEVLNE